MRGETSSLGRSIVARSGGLIRAILRTKYTRMLGRIIIGDSQWPCLKQGASLGEEAVLADSGWAGEVAARVGRVRSPAFLSILLGQGRYMLMGVG